MADELDNTGGSAIVVTDPIARALLAAQSALAEVIDEPVWPLTEEQAQARFASVLALRASAEELSARVLASICDRDVPTRDGAPSTRAWLMSKHGMSAGDASRMVAEAKAHPGDSDGITRDGRLEPTRAAWATGELPAERAVEIAGSIDKLDAAVPREKTDAVQADLLKHSRELNFRQFKRLCAHTIEVVDPESADRLLEQQLLDEEERALLQTALSFRRVGDGTTRFSGRLPDVQAEMFKAALDAHTSPRHTAAYAAVNGERLPDDREGWTYPQRLGRALLELLEHLPTEKLPQHGVANASIVVTMELGQLLGDLGETTLDTGTAMSSEEARRLACNAELIPVALGGPSQPLDLGASRRLFDRKQRMALAVRDGGCIFPSCERSPAWSEAHHITPWCRGGPTDLRNGCLLCPYHHHLIHKGEWAVRMAADGKPEIIPPVRIDATRTPRRHDRLGPSRC